MEFINAITIQGVTGAVAITPVGDTGMVEKETGLCSVLFSLFYVTFRVLMCYLSGRHDRRGDKLRCHRTF